MTYKTHKVFSSFFVLIGCMLLYYYTNPVINYYVYLMLGLGVAAKGALFCDIDHNWGSVKDKTAINKVLNFLIRVTGGKHRSRHTHSIDLHILFGILFYIVPKEMLSLGYIDIVNYNVINLVLYSFWLGIGSHLFSDMLSSDGVYLSCFLNIKLKFVPKVVFKGTRYEFKFNTGDVWEECVYTMIKILNRLVGIIAIIFPILLKLISK